MQNLNQKLNALRERSKQRKLKIMIIGLGSVGNYLLDYLVSTGDEDIEIIVAGRNEEKMTSDANIVRVAASIRHQNHTKITVVGGVNLDDVSSIANVISNYEPDIIVNSSRAYSGLKYGSISWPNVRAYGIWTPLSIKYTRNIMEAYSAAESNAIVINTSYSDAVIPWLKTSGMAYPDFGSGNINHLLPRIRFAVAQARGIEDFWNIDIVFAVSHFHDVVISKEGQCEGVDMLIDIRYRGQKVDVPLNEMFEKCAIVMPTDAKRNQMNASSNFEIIKGILDVVRDGKDVRLHCPGVMGEIGGYPIILDGSGDSINAYIDESCFSIEQMRAKNRESIYLDGIENVCDGKLIYTDELIAKVEKAFGVTLPKIVSFDEIEEVADFIINEIIKKNVK